jgi:hypothetical protein
MKPDGIDATGNLQGGDDAQGCVIDAQAHDGDDLPAAPSRDDASPADEQAPTPSEARQIANRANAGQSTGPRTAHGKKKSSRNAVTHGLLSTALLPDEDEQDFDEFRDGVIHDYQPVGTLEGELVQLIVMTFWRLRRIPRLETEILSQASILAAREHEKQLREDPPELMVTRERELTCSVGNALDQPSTAFWTSVQQGDPIPKLSRYQAQLERALNRYMMALERLQLARKGVYALRPLPASLTTDPEQPV